MSSGAASSGDNFAPSHQVSGHERVLAPDGYFSRPVDAGSLGHRSMIAAAGTALQSVGP